MVHDRGAGINIGGGQGEGAGAVLGQAAALIGEGLADGDGVPAIVNDGPAALHVGSGETG